MKKFSTLIAVFFAISASAQLSLEQCQSLAREHYPAIKQYEVIQATKEYSLSNAARAWIPQLSLSSQAVLYSDVAALPDPLEKMLEMQGLEVDGMRNDQYKVALDLRQNIWDGGVAKANAELIKADALEQKSRLDVEIYKITEKINDLFLGALLIDDRIGINKKKLELLNISFNEIKSYYRNGLAMQSDVDALEVEILVAQQSDIQLQSAKTSYIRLLELFIGESLGDRSLIRPSQQTNPSLITILRPELAMYQAQRDKIGAQLGLIRSRVMPKFELFAHGYYGYPGMDYFKAMFDSKWTVNGYVGVGMKWNFSLFSMQKNEKLKLKSAARMVQIQEDVFRFQLDMEQVQENSDLLRLKKSIELDNKIFKLKTSVREAAEAQLNNGVIKTSELLQKISEENMAELALSIHEIELLQAIYKLKYTINN